MSRNKRGAPGVVSRSRSKTLLQGNSAFLCLNRTAFLFCSQDPNYRRAVELAVFVESALMKNTLPPPRNHGSALAPPKTAWARVQQSRALRMPGGSDRRRARRRACRRCTRCAAAAAHGRACTPLPPPRLRGACSQPSVGAHARACPGGLQCASACDMRASRRGSSAGRARGLTRAHWVGRWGFGPSSSALTSHPLAPCPSSRLAPRTPATLARLSPRLVDGGLARTLVTACLVGGALARSLSGVGLGGGLACALDGGVVRALVSRLGGGLARALFSARLVGGALARALVAGPRRRRAHARAADRVV